MRLRSSCWYICFAMAVALSATVAQGTSLNVLQVEGDGSTDSGIQYAPVDFAGHWSYSSGGVTYHALSSRTSTLSGHAQTVRGRLLAAQGPGNPVTDDWCLYADGFLDNYIQTSDADTYAVRPSTVGHNIKIVNNSWVYSYGSTAADVDAVRRTDYMIHREDLVMTNAAVSPWPTQTPLLWASRNGISVRGTQTFTPSHGAGIGKTHADLWGPKSGTIDEVSSYETPGVAGYAAALITAAGSTNATHHEVVKSILMTGADKTAFTAPGTTGFTSWTSNGVNNLDNYSGAGRADYNTSLSVLNGGSHSMATVTGTTVNSPIVTTATAGWWYESALSGLETEALVVNVAQGGLTNLTATLAWDVTQTETTYLGNDTLNTTDAGVKFPNLDLELLPVTCDGGVYHLGSSLGIAGLMSESTDDNVEHLYFTNTLASGLYAFVLSNHDNVAYDYGYGFSYRFATVPEPGTLSLLVIFILCMCCAGRARAFRGKMGSR
jgi:hypothetical protein